MDSFGDRLRFWRESLGWTQGQLADRWDVSVQTVGRYERDLRSPEKNEFALLVEAGADIVWLVSGHGSAVPQSPSQAALPASQVALPRYDAALSAGRGFSEPDTEDVDEIFISEEFVRRVLRRSPKGLVVARADGDSMVPTILHKDILVIDTADKRLQNRRIYALSVDGNLFVKRINRPIKGPIQLVSDNKEYATEELPDDVNIRIIGQVIWHVGSLE